MKCSQYNGDDWEFIELFNPGSSALDLSGYRVELWDSDLGTTFGGADGAAPYVIPGGKSIAAGGYYLFANSLATTNFGVTADQSLPLNAIENSSYTVVLKDARGTGSIQFWCVTAWEIWRMWLARW